MPSATKERTGVERLKKRVEKNTPDRRPKPTMRERTGIIAVLTIKGERYELCETLGFLVDGLRGALERTRARRPRHKFIAVRPTEETSRISPATAGHIYIQSDTPILFDIDAESVDE